MIYEMFMERVTNGTNTPFASKIYKVVCEIENEIKNECESRYRDGASSLQKFESPLNQVSVNR